MTKMFLFFLVAAFFSSVVALGVYYNNQQDKPDEKYADDVNACMFDVYLHQNENQCALFLENGKEAIQDCYQEALASEKFSQDQVVDTIGCYVTLGKGIDSLVMQKTQVRHIIKQFTQIYKDELALNANVPEAIKLARERIAKEIPEFANIAQEIKEVYSLWIMFADCMFDYIAEMLQKKFVDITQELLFLQMLCNSTESFSSDFGVPKQ